MKMSKAVMYLLLSFFGVTMLVPFLWMVSTSLKDPGTIFNFPPEWIPGHTTVFAEQAAGRCLVRPMGEAGPGFRRVKFLEGPSAGTFRDIPSKALKREWKLDIHWDNYPRAWKAIPFGRGYINSL